MRDEERAEQNAEPSTSAQNGPVQAGDTVQQLPPKRSFALLLRTLKE